MLRVRSNYVGTGSFGVSCTLREETSHFKSISGSSTWTGQTMLLERNIGFLQISRKCPQKGRINENALLNCNRLLILYLISSSGDS